MEIHLESVKLVTNTNLYICIIIKKQIKIFIIYRLHNNLDLAKYSFIRYYDIYYRQSSIDRAV